MRTQNDLTTGNPLKKILLFALPIICGNIFQQMYNVVDTVIVGHVLGESAIAAVGGTAALYSFFVSIATGMTNGFSIVIARIYGERNQKKLKSAVMHTVMITIVIGFVMTVVAMIGMRSLLSFLNTPTEIIEESLGYIQTILLFFMITMFYNMFAGILRGIGNSMMPLLFLVVSVFCNIILDIIFIRFLGMGIRGAAVATMISQFISVILNVIYVYKKCPILHINKKDFQWNFSLCADLFLTGLSMAMMFSIVAVGSITLQGAINSLGMITIAAHSAARKIDEMLTIIVSPLSMAASTYASQNYGARKYARIEKGIRAALLLGLIVGIFVNIFVFIAAKPVVHIITGSDNEELLSTAAFYMKTNMPFYIFLVTFCVLRSTLQGLGRKVLPLSTSVIEMTGKVIIASFFVPRIGYLGVCIAEPIVWFLGAAVTMFDFGRVLRSKKFREVSV